MKIVSIVLRALVTLAVIWGVWTLAADFEAFKPYWLVFPVAGLLAFAWVIVFLRLASPAAGIWALVLLAVVFFALCGLTAWLNPSEAPDWTAMPFFAAVIGIWLLLLRLRLHLLATWEGVKRVAHALTWFAVSLMVAAIPGAIAAAIASDYPDLAFAIVFAVLLPGPILLTVYAVRGRWSLAWPLIVLFVVSWPFGVSVPLVVGFIGLGKLIIHAVGRGRTLAASELRAPTVGARPRGLVESANYD